MPNSCSKCTKPIPAGSSPISCYKCRGNFHPVCVNVAKKDQEYLSETNAKWVCPSCTTSGRLLRSGSTSTDARSTSPSSPSVSATNDPITIVHFNALMEQMRAMNAGLERVGKRVDDLFTKLDICTATLNEHSSTLAAHESSIQACKSDISCLQDAHTSLSNNITSIAEKIENVESTLSLIRKDVPADDLPEILDRVKKSFNLIITNLPEREDNNDLPVVGEIVDLISANSSRYLTNTMRIQSKDKRKPRWTKLTFSNPEIASTILRNKTSLQGNQKYHNIRIQDDKTRAQISTLNAAREELKRRQDLGDTDITIKYIKGTPTVVSLPPGRKNEDSKN